MTEAVVLAGGFGTRLRSVVPQLPKPMAPVAGRPFLEILLTALAGKGVERAVLSLGFQADVIQRHFGSRFAGIDLVACVEDTPLGTGGAIRAALQCCEAATALVVNGDTFLDLDLAALQQLPAPVIVGLQVDDAARFGRLHSAGGRVTGFSEKGPAGPGVVNSGHYWLPATLFDGSNLPAAFSFEIDYLPQAVQQRHFGLFVEHATFIDIGIPDDWQRAQTLLASFAA